MKVSITAIIALSISHEAHAQQWTATWKSTNGAGCGDGIFIQVTEQPGFIKIHSDGNRSGIGPSDREVKTAADGSGRLDFKSPTYGDLVLEVPAGKGKRSFTQKQANGICRWATQ